MTVARLRVFAVLLWACAVVYAVAVPLAWQRAHEGGPLWQDVGWAFVCGSLIFAAFQTVRQGWQTWKEEG